MTGLEKYAASVTEQNVIWLINLLPIYNIGLEWCILKQPGF